MKLYQGYVTREGNFKMTDDLTIDLDDNPMVAFVIGRIEAENKVEAERKFKRILNCNLVYAEII